jgi:hypothetical protein
MFYRPVATKQKRSGIVDPEYRYENINLTPSRLPHPEKNIRDEGGEKVPSSTIQ